MKKNVIPSIIKTTPIIIAIYTGWLSANIARNIETIPSNATNIDVIVDTVFIRAITPVIPNKIIINPII